MFVSDLFLYQLFSYPVPELNRAIGSSQKKKKKKELKVEICQFFFVPQLLNMMWNSIRVIRVFKTVDQLCTSLCLQQDKFTVDIFV